LIPYWHAHPGGVSVNVKVQPRSRRPGVQGSGVSTRGPCLRIGVSDPPEDGRANRAVCAVLAGVLGVPASAIAVAFGETSRDKTLRVAGEPALLIARLEAL
jgi:uncharacterized protein YggU (UPF0235/DUF167 family)